MDVTGLNMAQTQQAPAVIEVGPDDLPLHCPMPGMPLWSAHPRVFLDIAQTGMILCPYCGTQYQLRPGSVIHGH